MGTEPTMATGFAKWIDDNDDFDFYYEDFQSVVAEQLEQVAEAWAAKKLRECGAVVEAPSTEPPTPSQASQSIHDALTDVMTRLDALEGAASPPNAMHLKRHDECFAEDRARIASLEHRVGRAGWAMRTEEPKS